MSTPKGMAPETHNDEQDDERSQAQTVARDAQYERPHSPLDSTTGDMRSEIMGDTEKDLIDTMREMDDTGQIDMDAYRGEPNYDDNEGKYGEAAKPDPDLPSDGE